MCVCVCFACLLWAAHKCFSLVGILIYDDEIITLHTHLSADPAGWLVGWLVSGLFVLVWQYVCIFVHSSELWKAANVRLSVIYCMF